MPQKKAKGGPGSGQLVERDDDRSVDAAAHHATKQEDRDGRIFQPLLLRACTGGVYCFKRRCGHQFNLLYRSFRDDVKIPWDPGGGSSAHADETDTCRSCYQGQFLSVAMGMNAAFLAARPVTLSAVFNVSGLLRVQDSLSSLGSAKQRGNSSFSSKNYRQSLRTSHPSSPGIKFARLIIDSSSGLAQELRCDGSGWIGASVWWAARCSSI